LISVPISWFHEELGAFRTFEIAISGVTFVTLVWPTKRLSPGSLRVVLPRWARILFWGSALVYLLAATLSRYASFEVNGFDFSIFDWMLESTLRGRFMFTPIYGVNHFSVHPSYVMVPLVALHALCRSPITLLVFGALLVWAAGIPLWQLAMALTHEEGLALFAVVALWGNPWTAPLILDGFRIESFYPLASLLLLSGWVRRRSWTFWAGAILLLATKEDAALYLIGFSIAAACFDRRSLLTPIVLLVTSIGVLFLDLKVVQPLAGGGRGPGYVKFWSGYGASLSEIVFTSLKRPWSVLRDVANSGWYRFFGPALLLPLLNPRSLLTLLPGILMLGLASYPAMHRYHAYYAVPFVAFSLWGILAFSAGKATVSVGKLRYRASIVALLIFPIIGAGYVRTPMPHWQALRGTDEAAKQLAGFEGPVCAQGSLFPHLPYDLDPVPLGPDCLERDHATALIGTGENPWPYTEDQLHQWIDKARSKGKARLLSGGVYLLLP